MDSITSLNRKWVEGIFLEFEQRKSTGTESRFKVSQEIVSGYNSQSSSNILTCRRLS